MSEKLTIVLGPRLRDWEGTLRYALKNAGQEFKVALAREYQAHPAPKGGRRTHVMGKTAHGEVEDLSLKLEAVSYARYALWGTGLWGPKHEMIVPKEKKILAWQVRSGGKLITSGSGHTGSEWTAAHLGERWVFATKSRGYKWGGSLGRIKRATIKGVGAGIKKALKEGRTL